MSYQAVDPSEIEAGDYVIVEDDVLGADVEGVVDHIAHTWGRVTVDVVPDEGPAQSVTERQGRHWTRVTGADR